MKYQFPVKVHSGLKLVVTQPYGATSLVDFYTRHNGVDVVLSGDNLQTYGTEIATPSAGWIIKKLYWYDDAYSPNGNGVVIHSPIFKEDGIDKFIELRFVHLSAVAKGLEEGMVVPENTVLGYIGNSGLVSPKPTSEKPCSGTHLHLGLCVYHVIDGAPVLQDAKNGLYGLIDPLTRLDIDNPLVGKDTGLERDLPAFLWALQNAKIKEPWEVIPFALKYWWNGKL